MARAADGKELSDFEIVDDPYAFYVKGAAIERFVQMTNWDYFESFKRFAQVLKMSGVEQALNSAGAGEGDRIVLSMLEHHSNIVPWPQWTARTVWLLVASGSAWIVRVTNSRTVSRPPTVIPPNSKCAPL